jgi:hypothetical protein
MSEYFIDASNVESRREYKIVSEWDEIINTLSEEMLEQVNNGSELVRIALTAVAPRFQHPHTWKITDAEWNLSTRPQTINVWTLIAEKDQIDNIKKNIRIIKH